MESIFFILDKGQANYHKAKGITKYLSVGGPDSSSSAAAAMAVNKSSDSGV
uniref:Uncharacterized protein n=1 Tax=Utricularia reniformis TaxID=192314 RepID=A0A1Y0B087_9LAMI|nr:hypothetical protein AEK19_MT0571 [Utricularia reniformis]ART30827.1 hypothetical protein AEK19_MT0571 [Utricularia reniformis]